MKVMKLGYGQTSYVDAGKVIFVNLIALLVCARFPLSVSCCVSAIFKIHMFNIVCNHLLINVRAAILYVSGRCLRMVFDTSVC